MRMLQLSHDEIELIQRALGIAEMQFATMRKNYIEQLVNVRGVNNLKEVRKEADGMFSLENAFSDLLLEIKNGDKDV